MPKQPGERLNAGKVKSFEDLRIWQEVRELAGLIYADFVKGKKGFHDFDLKGQLCKAGLSIMNNIAEGFERGTDPDFARFLDIAKGSCGEVRSMYYTVEDLGYTTPETAADRRGRAKQLTRGIASLASHLRKDQ